MGGNVGDERGSVDSLELGELNPTLISAIGPFFGNLRPSDRNLSANH